MDGSESLLERTFISLDAQVIDLLLVNHALTPNMNWSEGSPTGAECLSAQTKLEGMKFWLDIAKNQENQRCFSAN